MSGRRILVTGAAGFVGSFVAARLAAMGHQVTGCDNFNDYYDPQLKLDRVAALLQPAGIACEKVDIADNAALSALFDRVQPELVVHLAAQAGVRYSLQNPSAYIQSNLVGFGNILEACRRHRIEHLLYASSSSVYGSNAKVPFSEADQVDEPVSLYAATKKANELMAYSYSHLYGFPATGLRFFTVYGPWGRPDMAYFSFTEKMVRGEKIPVFAEGKLTRDFTYIDDIVEGVVRLLFKPQPEQGGKARHAVFNIGNNQPVMVLDFVRTLERVLGVQAQLDFQPMQAGDVPATHADTSRLQEWVGYRPSTALETGLSHYRDWYRSWRA
ncbi:NAD-dependent epimerase/dehydratase family protein [Massilia sp. YIM B02443]|uniref:NAD-dependent epimerase/dehydratase family protein n=1 Tax=Massilia sp. YIM B02443 TaxID=3050127 RepID=UPI0025B6D369|nr:NAD-dependent epimerase/dehydratase family protein [Massilia sp. YIM B02443]MDN4038057.1 NAD-dependent epimerase/dehydratase family protein [Massilia sp. YIM B02443]